MQTFDDLEHKAETTAVAFFDTHAKIARGAAWFVAGAQAVVGAVAALKLELPLAGLCVLTAAVVVWQLVKTRATVPVVSSPT